MYKCVSVFLVWILLSGCGRNYDAAKNLSIAEYESTLLKIAPYVVKKHDDVSYEDRFSDDQRAYYKTVISQTGGKLKYFHSSDTAKIFYYVSKDLTSLFEHYRGFGGYYRENEKGEIVFMNLLYYTPRLTKEEQVEREEQLFREMVRTGNVKAFIGNKKFVHTPNEDFYYDVKTNRWDYTEDSSWRILQEAQRVGKDTTAD